MKHANSARWLANPNRACSHLPRNFWTLCEFFIQYQRSSCSLSGHIDPPPIMLTIEFRPVSLFWAHSPITSKRLCSWCPLLDPHLTTYRWNIGVKNCCCVGIRLVSQNRANLLLDVCRFGITGCSTSSSSWMGLPRETVVRANGFDSGPCSQGK